MHVSKMKDRQNFYSRNFPDKFHLYIDFMDKVTQKELEKVAAALQLVNDVMSTTESCDAHDQLEIARDALKEILK